MVEYPRRDPPMRMVVYRDGLATFGGCVGARIISRMDLGRTRSTCGGGGVSTSHRAYSALCGPLVRPTKNLTSSGKTNSGAFFSTSGMGASGLLFDMIGRKRRGPMFVAVPCAVVARGNFSRRGRVKKSFDMRNDIVSGAFRDTTNTPAKRGSKMTRVNKRRDRPARCNKAFSPLRDSSLQSIYEGFSVMELASGSSKGSGDETAELRAESGLSSPILSLLRLMPSLGCCLFQIGIHQKKGNDDASTQQAIQIRIAEDFVVGATKYGLNCSNEFGSLSFRTQIF